MSGRAGSGINIDVLLAEASCSVGDCIDRFSEAQNIARVIYENSLNKKQYEKYLLLTERNRKRNYKFD